MVFYIKTTSTALRALIIFSQIIPSIAIDFGRPAQGKHHARSFKGRQVNNGNSDHSTRDFQPFQNKYDDLRNVAPFPVASVTQGGALGPTGTGSPSQGLFPTGTGGYDISTKLWGTGTVDAATPTLGSISPTGTVILPFNGSSSSSSSGSFNAKAKNNVAVYYGQTGATSEVKLNDLCSDQSVDIVILAFLTTFAGPGGYPTVNFGTACGGSAAPAMTAKGATGLLSCPDLGSQIGNCQAEGKKVLLSLGGADASSAFTSDDEASTFATQLWDLFGAGIGEDSGLRPFGAGIKIDGFDLDNENKQPAHYDTFVSALRKTFEGDSSKKYYISGAPQCPTPDASISIDAMKQMDFVWVQFYNNGACNVGASGFVDSVITWSKQLSGGPSLYIGAPACGGTACAGSGYVPPDQITGVIKSAINSGAPNLGGVMLWDGAEGYINKAGSGNYMSVVKAALR